MLSINLYLQNKGIEPNKESSTREFTVYNVDSFGNETILIGLVVDNKQHFWHDKANDIKGKLPKLIQNLNDADDYRSAVNYANHFITVFPEWISDREGEPIEEVNRTALYEELMQRIYKLQTFVDMTEKFLFTHSSGYMFLKNFSTSDFINDDGYKNYLKAAQEEDNSLMINNINEVSNIKSHYIYADNARLRNYPKLKTSRRRKPWMISISKAISKANNEHEEAVDMREMTGYGYSDVDIINQDKFRKEILS